MINRTKRLRRLHQLTISKVASKKPDDLRSAKIDLILEKNDILTVSRKSAEALSNDFDSMFSSIITELEKIDDSRDERYVLDSRAEKVYGYLDEANESLYNAIMFLNHMRDGTGD